MNFLERSRIEIGLTRPQALNIIGAKPGRGSLFRTNDADIDRAFVVRMSEVVSAYRTWKRLMLAELEGMDVRGCEALTMQELCELTGVREVNLVTLRVRGRLVGRLAGYEYVYPTSHVREFIESNSLVLADGRRRSRGHLANAFLRWYFRNRKESELVAV